MSRIPLPRASSSAISTSRDSSSNSSKAPAPVAQIDFVGKFIEKYGEGLHHMTINVKDFDAPCARLKADGIRVVDENKNWRGESEFYISPKSAFGTLIQVWDTI